MMIAKPRDDGLVDPGARQIGLIERAVRNAFGLGRRAHRCRLVWDPPGLNDSGKTMSRSAPPYRSPRPERAAVITAAQISNFEWLRPIHRGRYAKLCIATQSRRPLFPNAAVDFIPKADIRSIGRTRLVPDAFEFWQGRPSRLHDRLACTPDGNGGWKIQRLAPSFPLAALRALQHNAGSLE